MQQKSRTSNRNEIDISYSAQVYRYRQAKSDLLEVHHAIPSVVNMTRKILAFLTILIAFAVDMGAQGPALSSGRTDIWVNSLGRFATDSRTTERTSA